MALNAPEARLLCSTLLQPYREAGYLQLRRMVGHKESLEAQGPSGATYHLECFVSRGKSGPESLTVSAVASEVGAGRWADDSISVGFHIGRAHA